MIEERHHAIRQRILWGDRERFLHGLLCLRGSSTKPVELCEREPDRQRSRITSRRFAKSHFGRREVAARGLERSESRIGGAAIGIEAEGFFDFLDGTIQILHPGQRIAEHDLRLHVFGIRLEHDFGSGARVWIPARQNQKTGGLELDFRAVGQQIGRAHRFMKRVPEIAGLRVDHRQSVARLTEPRVLLKRVSGTR